MDFWRRRAAQADESVLFGPLFSGAFRIFGKRPEGVLRWIGRAWDAMTRDQGTMTVVGGAESVEIALSGVPAACRLPTVVASIEGSVLGIIDLSGHRGRIDVDETRFRSQGVVDMRATWRAA